MSKRKVLIALVIFLIFFVIIAGFIAVQINSLNLAHSTFENYYHFRGCERLLEKTDTYGICQTTSGEKIKIVLINGRWYLDGDGPGVW